MSRSSLFGLRGRVLILAAVRLGIWLLPLLVLVGIPFHADERFHTFRYGSQYANAPWEVITNPLSQTGAYLELGNFRPLGRIVERATLFATYLVSSWLRVPAHVVYGVVRILSAAVLLYGVWVLLRAAIRAWGSPELGEDRLGRVRWLFLVVSGATLVASNPGSAVVVFPGLYLLLGAVVFVVPARILDLRDREELGGRDLVGWGLAGAALAATHEFVYVAVPGAIVAVLLLWWRSDRPLRWRHPSVSATASLLAGFTLVALPVRIVIARLCDGGGCYEQSGVALDAVSFGDYLGRLVGTFPVLMWDIVDGLDDLGAETVDLLRFLLGAPHGWILMLVTGGMVYAGVRTRNGSREGAPWLAVALLAGAMLGAAEFLPVLSAGFQGNDPALNVGWREAGIAGGAWALLICAGLMAVHDRCGTGRRSRVAAVAIAVVAALLHWGTVRTNLGWVDHDRQRAEGPWVELAVEALAAFEPGREAGAVRCAIIRGFGDALDDPGGSAERSFLEALNDAALQQFDEPYCQEARPPG